MVDQKIVKEWVSMAADDLAFSKAAMENNLEYYLQVCFYLHQATEKILKAYILANDLRFEKIHDLNKLLRICAQDDEEFNELSESVRLLNPFYIGTRYPDVVINVNKSQAENALNLAEKIAVFVKEKIKTVEGEIVEEKKEE